MKLTEKEIFDRMEQARRLYSAGQYSEAINIYSAVKDHLTDDPENLPIVQIELGWAYYQNQQYDRAKSSLLEALNSGVLTPQQEFDCIRLAGFCEELAGKRREAIAYLQKAISIDVPESSKRFAYFELGKILFTDGQIIEAEHYLTLSRPLFTDSEKNYQAALSFYLGFSAFFQKNYGEASQQFTQVVQHAEDPQTTAGGYFGLAHLHHQRKEYPAVIDICEKIIRLDHTFFDKESLGYFMCDAHMHLKNWEDLEVYLSELKKNYPEGRFKSEYARMEQALQLRQIPPAPSQPSRKD